MESEADDLRGVVDTVVPEPAVLGAFVKGSKRRDKGYPYCAPTTKYTPPAVIEIQNINRNAESPTERAIALLDVSFTYSRALPAALTTPPSFWLPFS